MPWQIKFFISFFNFIFFQKNLTKCILYLILLLSSPKNILPLKSPLFILSSYLSSLTLYFLINKIIKNVKFFFHFWLPLFFIFFIDYTLYFNLFWLLDIIILNFLFCLFFDMWWYHWWKLTHFLFLELLLGIVAVWLLGKCLLRFLGFFTFLLQLWYLFE